MDSLHFLADTVQNHFPIQNDTIVYKVLTVGGSQGGFYKMDNPLWYILTLFAGALFVYLFTLSQKKKEAVTEAKKVFLNKRIEINQQLLLIFSKCLIVTNPTPQSKQVFYKIFESSNDMNNWFDELVNYANSNKLFLSKNVNYQLNLLNNLRSHLHYLITHNPMTDEQLIFFSIKYHKEFSEIFNNTERAIVSFFETEISINFHYDKLTNKDYNKVQDELFKYELISKNSKKDQIV